MTTFYGSPSHMMAAVADAVAAVDANTDVHTITLVLNGQHGEFDLTIEASDADGEQVVYKGIAHRSGGVAAFGRICDWDGNTDEVKESHGEWLCKHCRAVVAYNAIIDAV